MSSHAVLHLRARRRLTSALLGVLLALGCSESDPAPGASMHAVSTSCGSKGLPDCPLQGWMKDTLRTHLNAGDKARLTSALEKLAENPPRGFDGWSESAARAAKAASAGDIAAVKAECKVCHDQHRSRFRAEMRSAPLF